MIRKIVSSKFFRWTIMGLYAGLIFMVSSMSIEEIVEEPGLFYLDLFSLPYMDKVVHFIEYALLCTLLCWAISAHLKGLKTHSGDVLLAKPAKLVFIAIIVTSLYGITDEFHQLFVPTRMGTVYDWLADTAGATIAGLCWLKFHPAWKRSVKN